MKYSCALYDGDACKGTLDEAEVRMLESYVVKAGLEDGMSILDLGFVSSFFSLMVSRSCVTNNYCIDAVGDPPRSSSPKNFQIAK